MDSNTANKEVLFWKYCVNCKHSRKAENEEPCWECLTNPVNDNSHRPVMYEEDK